MKWQQAIQQIQLVSSGHTQQRMLPCRIGSCKFKKYKRWEDAMTKFRGGVTCHIMTDRIDIPSRLRTPYLDMHENVASQGCEALIEH